VKWFMGFISGLWASSLMVTLTVIREGTFTNIMPTYKIIIGIVFCIIFSIIVHIRSKS
jgi:hypothetical protein